MRSLEKVSLCSTEKDEFFLPAPQDIEIYPPVCRDLSRLLLRDIFLEFVGFTLCLEQNNNNNKKPLGHVENCLGPNFQSSFFSLGCLWLDVIYVPKFESHPRVMLSLASLFLSCDNPQALSVEWLLMRLLPFPLLYLCPHQSTLWLWFGSPYINRLQGENAWIRQCLVPWLCDNYFSL